MNSEHNKLERAGDPDFERWEALAEKEMRGKGALERTTPEGITVKALYTKSDLDGLEHLDTLPGLEPFMRGPRAAPRTCWPWDRA